MESCIDIAFVILNYNIIDETIDCITSIQKNIDTRLYHIFVVDNGSKHEIINELKQRIASEKNITMIVNEKNLGFACGNNIGILAARNLGAKYICCLNNDTILRQKDFFKKIESTYNNGNPALIGPRIRLKDGRILHIYEKLKTSNQYEESLRKTLNSDCGWRNKVKCKLINYRIVYEINDLIKGRLREKARNDVVLHGCCLIFTPMFFEKLKGFDDRTFLYGEEELLFIKLMNNNLHSRYEPNLEIIHLEDVSTNSIVRTNKDKELFIKKHRTASLNIIIEEIKKMENKL